MQFVRRTEARRRKLLGINLTEQECAAVDSEAKHLGVTRSDFVRTLLEEYFQDAKAGRAASKAVLDAR